MRFWLTASLALLFPMHSQAEIPLEDFLKDDSFGTIEISPDGQHLAATVPMGNRTSLVILRMSDLGKTGHVTLPEKSHVIDYDWVNDDRILFSIGETQGALEQPRATGELYGVNADGSGQGPALIGYRSAGNKYTRESKRVAASIISLLREEPKYVLVAVNEFGGAFTSVERLQVETGRRTVVARAPVRNASFLADPQGVVRFAIGTGSDLQSKTYYRADGKSEWQLLNDQAQSGVVVGVLGFNQNASIAYLQSEQTEGPDAIESFDTRTGKRALILRDKTVDPSGVLTSPIDGDVWGVIFNGPEPRVEYLAPQHPLAKAHAGLAAALPGQLVIPTGFTRDGMIGLFRAFSSQIPGDFYLFDRKTGQARYLASRAGWFKPEDLAPSKSITIEARDGLTLPGILTLPKDSDGKNMPLVINPHGGPFGVFDTMQYDLDAQILASRGFAVLKVNFRGSGNYGRAFERAGYRQWGRAMQDDLTDATRWAIAEGIADPERIAIYGASYGAYAALMGVAREPELYACAIGNVGVYDMPMMYSKGDVQQSRIGTNFLRESLGEEGLADISPSRLADRITVPVLLLAGAEDERAPAAHTEAMRDALKRLNKPVDSVIYPGEGHGSYLLKNRLDTANRILTFLDQQIGTHKSK